METLDQNCIKAYYTLDSVFQLSWDFSAGVGGTKGGREGGGIDSSKEEGSKERQKGTTDGWRPLPFNQVVNKIILRHPARRYVIPPHSVTRGEHWNTVKRGTVRARQPGKPTPHPRSAADTEAETCLISSLCVCSLVSV